MVLVLMVLGLPALASEWPDLSTPADAGRQRNSANDAALIVAIGDYAGLPDIPGAVQNGRDWHQYFSDSLQIPPAQMVLLTDGNAIDEQILKSAREVAEKAGEGGRVWVVFIGHGAVTREGSVLVAWDAQANPDSISLRSVRQQALLEVVSQGRQAETLMVLDACFSGKDNHGKELLAGLQFMIPPDPPPSTATVLTAAGANEFAGALPGEARPAFSYLVLGALRGWGDANGDGAVTALEASEYAKSTLATTVHGRTQTPEVSGNMEAVLSRSHEEAPDLGAIIRGLAKAAPVSQSRVAVGVTIDRGEDVINTYTDKSGWIKLTSDPPEASIFLNGEELGPGPHQRDEMLGHYVVTAELGGLYHPAREEFDLAVDGMTLELVLEEAFGDLSITSDPVGAVVWLDDEEVGPTPWSVSEKPSGDYQLRLTAPFHRSYSGVVTIHDSRLAEYHAVLDATFGSLTVDSDPPGAAITINKESTGEVTPYTFSQLNPGVAVVKLTLPGHGDTVEQIDIIEDQRSDLDAALTPRLGVLTVTAVNAAGQTCEGDVTLDGVKVGKTPYKDQLPALNYQVKVACGEETAEGSFTVIHNDRVDAKLKTKLEVISKRRVYAQITNIDDEAKLTVNGRVALEAAYGDNVERGPGRSRRIDLGPWLQPGANMVHIQAWNSKAKASAHFIIEVDGEVVIDKSFAKSPSAANKSHMGLVLDEALWLNVEPEERNQLGRVKRPAPSRKHLYFSFGGEYLSLNSGTARVSPSSSLDDDETGTTADSSSSETTSETSYSDGEPPDYTTTLDELSLPYILPSAELVWGYQGELLRTEFALTVGGVQDGASSFSSGGETVSVTPGLQGQLAARLGIGRAFGPVTPYVLCNVGGVLMELEGQSGGQPFNMRANGVLLLGPELGFDWQTRRETLYWGASAFNYLSPTFQAYGLRLGLTVAMPLSG